MPIDGLASESRVDRLIRIGPIRAALSDLHEATVNVANSW
jgi:hypothetical protein